jgi:hypothetical protein
VLEYFMRRCFLVEDYIVLELLIVHYLLLFC